MFSMPEGHSQSSVMEHESRLSRFCSSESSSGVTIRSSTVSTSTDASVRRGRSSTALNEAGRQPAETHRWFSSHRGPRKPTKWIPGQPLRSGHLASLGRQAEPVRRLTTTDQNEGPTPSFWSDPACAREVQSTWIPCVHASPDRGTSRMPARWKPPTMWVTLTMKEEGEIDAIHLLHR